MTDDYKEPVDDIEVDIEGNDIEIEVVDDTPEEDKGRTPLPEEVTKTLDDELEGISDKVKQRLSQQTKARHDERRLREKAERERDEAVSIAKSAYTERQQLREQLQQGEAWAMGQSKQRAAMEVENAKKLYREAYDAGDGEKLVDAQQKLNFAILEFDKIHHYRPQHTVQAEESVVHTKPEPRQVKPAPDDRAVEWADENPWYGVDRPRTLYALGVHEELINEGVKPSTEEYYEKLDSRVKKVFPDEVKEKKPQPSTVVAPVGRSPKGKKVVLTQTQVALARRLGITTEAYAKEVLKGMDN